MIDGFDYSESIKSVSTDMRELLKLIAKPSPVQCTL